VVTAERAAGSPEAGANRDPGDRYKWTALFNVTLGVLMATIDSSIMLIAMPDIFRGIRLDPLEPGNSFYLLWMILGFLVVSSVLVVSLGRLGDMYGRVKMYNFGFLVYTLSSLLLTIDWMTGRSGALWLIVMRIVQGIGSAFIIANSGAILTDAFPADQRGLALGINNVAGISGSFLGLVLGGVLAPIEWRLVFLISVPIGALGTWWAYAKLRDNGIRRPARIDWWGNLTFAAGLILVMIGITYGIEPYGRDAMGWTSPAVLSELIGGGALLVTFGFIETRVENPMFRLPLFKIKAFTFGTLSTFLSAIGRGGLMFMLIIWLQGIWLPEHGFSFTRTPLWAGIYMLPLTAGFLLLNGIGMGAFAAPNRAGVMNSLPPQERGAGGGMNSTFQNSAQVLSIGIFFSLMIAGLSRSLSRTLSAGLISHGVNAQVASQAAGRPPVSILFAAFLGYNPVQSLVPPSALKAVGSQNYALLTGRSFFSSLISGPFQSGLHEAFLFAICACLVAAAASWSRGRRYVDSSPEGV
jgi:MFS family permease